MNRRIWWSALAIAALDLALRLTGLGQIESLVFDEVYYVPFALDYLQGTPSFDAHPPLGKYFIALGLWLGQWPALWLGWPSLEVNGTLVSPLAFRWLNALVGATIPVLLAAIAWELGTVSKGDQGDRFPLTEEDPPKSPLKRGTLKQLITPLLKGGRGDLLTLRQYRFALLAGLLMAMEGLTLVESRLALINIYGLALGLLGQWAWLRARQSQHPVRWRCLAGIALGAAVNVKWNWAGLWLGLLLWEIGFNRNPGSITPKTTHPAWRDRLVYLGMLPLLTYLLLWLPHLALTNEALVTVHQRLWSTHQSIGANGSHTYCSPWHSWPLMVRPVAYFFERSGQGAEAVATTIHAMGNPVLWWLSTAAILVMALGWLGRQVSVGAQPAAPLATRAVVPFILLNYLANWLPWALVSRCTFFYHAMGLGTFGTLGLAWLMAQWLENRRDRTLALLLLGAIALSFWFWLPLYLGLPLPVDALQRRWLLPGWI
ncbi:phospholipid carrier-dependent glycosyltransferase [Nodosilinea sp. E11]|uniref:phospholipid carrier-dependent glycosyltransferase n=1 Tax=Nodosilinea sp. E11 TaxID=3037479 RepID=UPI00293516D4|nr:phospholipid carrier-dependent glycosyltransferase [Nodosilinea sp. E11]WOD39536.1 phospholipid carrier-dependent glycosyltransferase [Nodosilinea sp. E11]